MSHNHDEPEAQSLGMRTLSVSLVAILASLAGCTDASGTEEPTADSAQDFGVAPTATTGVLLGVVVDETITPIMGVKVKLNLPDGTDASKETDGEGRFAFGDLAPGDYFIAATHFKYGSAQITATVVAGEENPPINKIQLSRLFSQDPYMETITYDGYLACAYAIGVSSTCVNDYTRVTGEQCLPNGECYCAGGCLRDQELARQGGNLREYVSVVGPGWQALIVEMTWEPTSDLGKELGLVVSYFSRPDAIHRYGGAGGESPVRLQLDTGVEHESAEKGAADHTIVPSNGTEELFTFFSANAGSVTVNQQFKVYQTIFYYAVPPEGWSLVNGDPRPF